MLHFNNNARMTTAEIKSKIEDESKSISDILAILNELYDKLYVNTNVTTQVGIIICFRFCVDL